MISAFPLKLSAGVNLTFPKGSTSYLPTFAMINGVPVKPVFPELLGSIKIIVDASGVVSSTSVSLAPTVDTVIASSSFVVFPKSSSATGTLLVTVNIAGAVWGASHA